MNFSNRSRNYLLLIYTKKLKKKYNQKQRNGVLLMNILKKADFCPLCGNKINLITNPKCKLKDGNFVCKKCVIELVGLWKKDQEELLELNITQIKEKYKNRV